MLLIFCILTFSINHRWRSMTCLRTSRMGWSSWLCWKCFLDKDLWVVMQSWFRNWLNWTWFYLLNFWLDLWSSTSVECATENWCRFSRILWLSSVLKFWFGCLKLSQANKYPNMFFTLCCGQYAQIKRHFCTCSHMFLQNKMWFVFKFLASVRQVQVSSQVFVVLTDTSS